MITLDPAALLAARRECRPVDARVGVENTDAIQMVALADLEIVEVMARRDLERAGAELPVDIPVGDQRHDPAGDRQANFFAEQVLVARVFGMNRHRGVAEHGLRSGGGDDQRLARVVRQRITNMPEMAVGLFVNHLDIRQRGLAARAPIDQPLRTIK